MDTGNFIIYIKTNDIYKHIAEDVEKQFDTSNFELLSPLPKGKSKKVFGVMKNLWGGKSMKELLG